MKEASFFRHPMKRAIQLNSLKAVGESGSKTLESYASHETGYSSHVPLARQSAAQKSRATLL